MINFIWNLIEWLHCTCAQFNKLFNQSQTDENYKQKGHRNVSSVHDIRTNHEGSEWKYKQNKNQKNQGSSAKNNMGKKWEKKQKPNSQKFFAGSGGFSSKLSIIPWNGKILKKRRGSTYLSGLNEFVNKKRASKVFFLGDVFSISFF